MAGFLVGVVVGVSVTLLVLIIVAPSRRVRAESGMDHEVQLQLLLHETPTAAVDRVAASSDTPTGEFDTQEIQALRDLDAEPTPGPRPEEVGG
jgi:hypothetical protein